MPNIATTNHTKDQYDKYVRYKPMGYRMHQLQEDGTLEIRKGKTRVYIRPDGESKVMTSAKD
jgi:hypothetical protein